jgi:hypothetical protein
VKVGLIGALFDLEPVDGNVLKEGTLVHNAVALVVIIGKTDNTSF